MPDHGDPRQMQGPTVLDRILDRKRARLEQLRRQRPLADVREAAQDTPWPRDFHAALAVRGSWTGPEPQGRGVARSAASGEGPQAHDPAPETGTGVLPGVRVIAEIKRRSPSRGLLRPDLDVAALARAYTEGGAAALSVLTEQDNFDGSLDHLRLARAATHLPLLRKDFITDPYQVYETREAEADALLLIVAALEPSRLADLAALAAELGLAALVETHNEAEVRTALDTGAGIVGINNRNLRTLEVSLDTAIRLAPLVPNDRILVAESGIHGPADLDRLRGAGIHVFLVGEHLMLSPNVTAALTELTGVTLAAHAGTPGPAPAAGPHADRPNQRTRP